MHVIPATVCASTPCAASTTSSAPSHYKQIIISTNVNAVRVRLPLTDVTGKVRVKEKSSDGFGLPVAPSKTSLGKKHYLEWQIGYDIPDTNSPSVVPEIRFIRNGETKYGHELSKIIFETVRLGIISTNDLIREIESLKKVPPNRFEENQTVQVEIATNTAANGFQSAIQRIAAVHEVHALRLGANPIKTKTARCRFIRRWFMFACHEAEC